MRFRPLMAALTGAALLSGSCLTVSAAESMILFDSSGNAFTVTVSGSEATITSTALAGGATDLVIPEELGGYTVTEISSRAFFGSVSLTSVVLPQTLTSVGDYAFSGCFGLKTAVIPDTVTKLGEGCFASCSALDSVKLSASLSEIPERCFAACADLKNVTLPMGLTSIGDEAFYGCGDLTVYIPGMVSKIGTNALGMRYDLRSESFAPFDDFLILGMKGSPAETYAASVGADFIDPSDGLGGDVDGDGFVDAADASDVLQEYASTSTGSKRSFSRAQTFRADMNNDKITDSTDASEILELYALRQTMNC